MINITLHEVICDSLKKWGKKNFIYTRVENEFIPKTFDTTINDTWALAESLLSQGLAGKHILIYDENSYEWAISDLAIMGYVGVVVAANKEWTEYDLENVIKTADVDCIIYSNAKKDIIEKLKVQFDITYISMQNDFPLLLKKGYQYLSVKAEKRDFIIKSTNEMCKIIFTSGTTSQSKAVMLAGKNLFFGMDSLYKRAKISPEDKVFLFLPLSHTYAGIYNFLVCLYYGAELFLCSDNKKLLEEIQMVKPNLFCAVPLIYERIYSMLGEDLIREAQVNKNEAAITQIKNILGGNIKFLFCGGAKFNPDIRKFFKDIGFSIMEAYALTETASSLSIEYHDSRSITSVGTIFEDIEVKFNDVDENGHGEILVRGNNVALGYYNNPEETKKVFDSDGFFHTGDIGYKNDDNELFFVGRKKRVIVLNNGENIYPDEIEALLMESKGIAKAKVFEKNHQLAAIVYSDDDINAAEIIKTVNHKLPTYKQIKNFNVITDSISNRMK